MVREANKEELDQLLELYLHLHEDSIPEHDDHLYETWDRMVTDDDYHIIVNDCLPGWRSRTGGYRLRCEHVHVVGRRGYDVSPYGSDRGSWFLHRCCNR